MSVLSLLNILSSCAVRNCIDPDNSSGGLREMLGGCALILVVIGLAVLINRKIRD